MSDAWYKYPTSDIQGHFLVITPFDIGIQIFVASA